MKNLINTACDFCLTILDGKSGTAEVKQPYISIRGTMLYKHYDEDGKELYTYGQEKGNGPTDFHFCFDKMCLQEYLKTRQILIDENRRRWLEQGEQQFGY